MSIHHSIVAEESILPLPAYPQVAAALREQLRERVGKSGDEALTGWFQNYLADSDYTVYLDAVLGNSPYLGQLIFKHPALYRQLVTEGAEETSRRTLAELTSQALPEKQEELMQRLRIAKQQMALIIALADIWGIWPLEKVTESLSSFAGEALTIAVNFLLRAAVKAGEITLDTLDDPSFDSGLIILAMGKLGAMELNYSSDIDIVIFYDGDKLRYHGKTSPQHFCVKLSRELVTIMQERTKDGYVFRTDLRLRPDPGSTPLAISVSAAEVYYESVGQNWERAALIKARPVAGDIAAGQHFLQEVIAPFIWRKHLDFAAIEDIRSIKRQIDGNRSDVPGDLAGHNIKIGHGGIREIEFYAQTQQLIWGGREPGLRVSRTMEALRALVAYRHVKPEVAEDLIAIYRYYRTLEHRLQMVEDQQTHALPDTEEAIAAIACFMAASSAQSFMKTLRIRLLQVKKYYNKLFSTSKPLGNAFGSLVFTGTDNDPETVRTIISMGFGDGGAISERVRGWHHGRYRATRTKRARELITELMPAILSSMAGTAHPDTAFMKFDEFLSRLPAGIQLFSLFNANPELLHLVAEIMGSYPFLAENLSRNPALLEYVLSASFLESLPPKEKLAEELAQSFADTTYFEDILDAARRWTHEKQFQIGVQLIQALITPKEAREGLSTIAEAVLSALFSEVQHEFSRKHGMIPGGAFALIAVGKMGSRELTFRSDIDMVLVYDAPEEAHGSNGPEPLPVIQYYSRLSRRFISAITSLTTEGKLFDVDMRLRPSGGDGPLSTSLKTLDGYFAQAAKIWEYMALTRARVIAGPEALRANIGKVLEARLTQPQEPDSLAREVKEIREKIARSFPEISPWKIKYVRGGLIDSEFIAQYLQLRFAHTHPAILDSNSIRVFEKAAELQVINQVTAQELARLTRFLFDVQSIMRLAYQGMLTSGVRRLLVKSFRESEFSEVEKKLLSVQEKVREYFAKMEVL